MELEELAGENGCSLEDTLCDEPQPDKQYEMGPLEAKLEDIRARIIEKVPWTRTFLEGIDIKIGLAQGCGLVAGSAVTNTLFYVAGTSLAAYTAIMAASFAAGFVSIVGGYVAVHYLFNRDYYRGRVKELFYEALRFTGLQTAAFVPTRLVSLGLENLLVGLGTAAGFSPTRYIVGNVVPTLLLTMGDLGSNRAGKALKENMSLGEALKEGIKQVGHLLYLPVAGLRSAYDSIARKVSGDYAVSQPADGVPDVPGDGA